jgi:hypothetical protein
MNKKLWTRLHDSLVDTITNQSDQTKNLIICRCECITNIDVLVTCSRMFRSCQRPTVRWSGNNFVVFLVRNIFCMDRSHLLWDELHDRATGNQAKCVVPWVVFGMICLVVRCHDPASWIQHRSRTKRRRIQRYQATGSYFWAEPR